MRKHGLEWEPAGVCRWAVAHRCFSSNTNDKLKSVNSFTLHKHPAVVARSVSSDHRLPVSVSVLTQDVEVETGLCEDAETSDTDFTESHFHHLISLQPGVVQEKLYRGSLSLFQRRPDHIHTCHFVWSVSREWSGLSVEVLLFNSLHPDLSCRSGS